MIKEITFNNPKGNNETYEVAYVESRRCENIRRILQMNKLVQIKMTSESSNEQSSMAGITLSRILR